jgi:tetratricopeptide (TPR) repeat protein
LGAEQNIDLVGAYKIGEKAKVAKAINDTDEKELFQYLGEVFHKDFKASYMHEKMLSKSIGDNKFNCYSSSVILGDVLTQLGKPINVVDVPNHVFLIGKNYAFETTVENPSSMTFESKDLQINYPLHQVVSVDGILVSTYAYTNAALQDKNKQQKALAQINSALKLDPKDYDSLLNKIFLLEYMDRKKEAEQTIDLAIKVGGINTNFVSFITTYFVRNGRNEDAIATMDKYLKLNPGNDEISSRKINLLIEHGKYAEAIVAINKSLEENPKSTGLLFTKITTLEQMNKKEDALAATEDGLKLQPQNSNLILTKSSLLESLGRNEDALATISEPAKENPYLLYAKFNLLKKMGRNEDALSTINEEIVVYPDVIDLLRSKVDLLNGMGRKAEAEELSKTIESKENDVAKSNASRELAAAEEALGKDPNNAFRWWDKGVALERLGKTEEAIESYDKAAEISKNSGPLFAKAKMLDDIGNHEEAIKAMDKAIEMEKDIRNKADLFFFKSEMLKKAGRLEEAQDCAAQSKKTLWDFEVVFKLQPICY